MTTGQPTSASSVKRLREEASRCCACQLWKDATQTVFGEGPQHAQIMLVGEQPGDKEDLAGKPFVGPAGQILDRALEEAGVDRGTVYITNAVKHFKFVPRGKIRLHQKPNTLEIRACRQWYERELASIKPALVVAMGATAAQSVFGKITSINKNRGRPIDLDDGIKALVTVHPSYLLRRPPRARSGLRRFSSPPAAISNPLLAWGWRDTAMMFGPSATARSAVTQPSVVSLHFSEVRHVLRQHFDPPDHVADLSMTVFSS